MRVVCNVEENRDIQRGLDLLKRYEDKLASTYAMMFKAENSNLYVVDILFASAFTRFAKVSMGIRALIEQRNLICAAPLVRLQLDTVLRLFAASLVDDKNSFFERILRAQPIRRIKDRDGNYMTDSYLLDRLVHKTGLDELRGLYEKTSGFVHFSEIHLSDIMRRVDDDGGLSFRVGSRDEFFPESAYIEAITAVHDIHKLLMVFARDWINEKDRENRVEVIETKLDDTST